MELPVLPTSLRPHPPNKLAAPPSSSIKAVDFRRARPREKASGAECLIVIPLYAGVPWLIACLRICLAGIFHVQCQSWVHQFSECIAKAPRKDNMRTIEFCMCCLGRRGPSFMGDRGREISRASGDAFLARPHKAYRFVSAVGLSGSLPHRILQMRQRCGHRRNGRMIDDAAWALGARGKPGSAHSDSVLPIVRRDGC